MMEEMIYEEHKPTINDLMNDLGKLSMELQVVAWRFELSFSVVKWA